MTPSASKFKNRRTVVDGISFASAKEARRYGELKILERGGQIVGLELQPRFPIVISGLKVCTYVADFRYRPTNASGVLGEQVVEDAKGFRTPEYKLKRKLVQAVHGVNVVEV